jgi:hypothetical protein
MNPNNSSLAKSNLPPPPLPPSNSTNQKTAIATDQPGGYRLPDATTLQYASKLSIVDDKPIMLDYWTCSIDQTALIGVKDEGGEKLLVKSVDEYTSPIVKIYKVSNEFIVITENSIYLVDVNIPTKRIST